MTAAAPFFVFHEKPTILVVDDTPDNLTLMTALLKDDYRVKVAHNGERALRLVQGSDPPALVLLDIMMPRLNGFEVCQNIKASAHTRHIRVLAMTGYPSEDNIAAIHAAGAETCLTKPFHLNHLLDLLGVARRPGNPWP